MSTKHATRPRKWHHYLLGTVDQRRRLRDVALRQVGLTRCNAPTSLMGRDDLLTPNIVASGAAEILLLSGRLTFVQVGAFDGTSRDDLTSLLTYTGVRGVLVEPQPEPFAELQTRFGDHENLHLANVAIAPEVGQREMFRPRSGESRLASFDRTNLTRHGIAAEDIVCKSVRCTPLDSLLDDLAIERLDILQIDAEGFDLEVLATIDLDRWHPTWLRFEFLHLDSNRLAACLDDLSLRGYRFMVDGYNIAAKACS